MAKPGPPPKPSHLKLLNGSAKTHKNRVNQNEPDPDTDQIAPTVKLSDTERKIWDELVPELVRCNIAKNTDSLALTLLVQSEALRRTANEELNASGLTAEGSMGQVVVNPMFKAMLTAQDRVARLMVEFGMTASSRTRVNAPPPDKPSGFGID